MKAVHGYIRQSLAEHVIGELVSAGCHTISVIEVRGIVDTQKVKGLDYSVALAQRFEHVTKLEILATDEDAERWASVIARTARTGQLGDGVVCVLPVESAMRVSTGEHGEQMLDER